MLKKHPAGVRGPLRPPKQQQKQREIADNRRASAPRFHVAASRLLFFSSLLGLRRGAVQLVDHQPAWAKVFERERQLLQGRLGMLACDIQHVGSTAVPGLAAKPIIDIAVAIPSLGVLPDVRTSLVALGYLDRGDFAADGGHLFVRESAPDVRTHHVHVVRVDDPQWRNYLAFRDALRSDPRAQAEYGALKLGLGERVAHDRRAYAAGKVACIRRILGLG